MPGPFEDIANVGGARGAPGSGQPLSIAPPAGPPPTAIGAGIAPITAQPPTQPSGFQGAIRNFLGPSANDRRTQQALEAEAAQGRRTEQINKQVMGPMITEAMEIRKNFPTLKKNEVMLKLMDGGAAKQALNSGLIDPTTFGKLVSDSVAVTYPGEAKLHNAPNADGSTTVINNPPQGGGDPTPTYRTQGKLPNVDQFGNVVGAPLVTAGGNLDKHGRLEAPPQGRFNQESTKIDTPLRGDIDNSALEFGLPIDAWSQQVFQESSFVNFKGPILRDGERAWGPAGIKESTWNDDIAPALGYGPADLHDEAKNLRGGAYYMSKMVKLFDGDYIKGLMAYNWGPGNVGGNDTKAPWNGDWNDVPNETKKYVRNVTRGGFAIPQQSHQTGEDYDTRIENSLPDKVPATQADLKPLLDNSANIFLGTGFSNFFLGRVRELSRVMSPGITAQWMDEQVAANQGMDNLKAQIARLPTVGGGKLKIAVELILNLAPGGIFTDSQSALDQTISLMKDLDETVYESQQIVANKHTYGKKAAEQAMEDLLILNDVKRNMPSMDDMLQIKKLYAEGRGPSFGSPLEVGKTALTSLVAGFKGMGVQQQNFDAPAAIRGGAEGSPEVTQPTAEANGPKVTTLVPGPDGSLVEQAE